MEKKEVKKKEKVKKGKKVKIKGGGEGGGIRWKTRGTKKTGLGKERGEGKRGENKQKGGGEKKQNGRRKKRVGGKKGRKGKEGGKGKQGGKGRWGGEKNMEGGRGGERGGKKEEGKREGGEQKGGEKQKGRGENKRGEEQKRGRTKGESTSRLRRRSVRVSEKGTRHARKKTSINDVLSARLLLVHCASARACCCFGAVRRPKTVTAPAPLVLPHLKTTSFAKERKATTVLPESPTWRVKVLSKVLRPSSSGQDHDFGTNREVVPDAWQPEGITVLGTPIGSEAHGAEAGRENPEGT